MKTVSKAMCVWLATHHAMEATECSDDVFIEVILTLVEHYTTIKPPKPTKIIRLVAMNFHCCNLTMGLYN